MIQTACRTVINMKDYLGGIGKAVNFFCDLYSQYWHAHDHIFLFCCDSKFVVVGIPLISGFVSMEFHILYVSCGRCQNTLHSSLNS